MKYLIFVYPVCSIEFDLSWLLTNAIDCCCEHHQTNGVRVPGPPRSVTNVCISPSITAGVPRSATLDFNECGIFSASICGIVSKRELIPFWSSISFNNASEQPTFPNKSYHQRIFGSIFLSCSVKCILFCLYKFRLGHAVRRKTHVHCSVLVFAASEMRALGLSL